MQLLTQIIIATIAALHIYFLVLEMFFWDKPLGMRVFSLSAETAAASKTLAANQGLYNGFLSAGLVYGLALGKSGLLLTHFILVCIVIAGLYGAYSVNRRIAYIQAMPAIVALLLLQAN